MITRLNGKVVLAGSRYGGRMKATGPCGLASLGNCSPGIYVDHCHFHRLIRGELCNRHNQAAGYRGRLLDPGQWLTWAMLCPGCREEDDASPAYFQYLVRLRHAGHPG